MVVISLGSICNRTDVPITTQQINEAKLKAFQAIDAPSDPHSKVRSWFPYLLHKPAIVNDEIRRLYRLKLLEVNESNLVSACVQYLEKNENRSRMSIIGNKDEVPEEIKSSEEWIIVNEELSV